MKKNYIFVILCILTSCNSQNKRMKDEKKIKTISVGSSSTNNKKRFEEMHPEVKKSISHLLETNKDNGPTIGSKNEKKSNQK
jgi:hypothetical protein